MKNLAVKFIPTILCLAPFLALAQDPPKAPPPPPAWTGSLGGGLSITSGNTDARAYNLAFDLKYDPQKKFLAKFGALYLRSEKNGVADAERIGAVARGEFKFTPRLYAFAETGYQRDRFKNLSSLFAPIAGAGYRVVDQPNIILGLEAGAGGRFESYVSADPSSKSSFALNAGENFMWKISETSTLKQTFSALWNGDDTSDAIYHAEVSLSSAVWKKVELKIAYLWDYRNQPKPSTLDKTDTALLAAVVWKF